MATENIGWDPLRIELLWDLKERPRRGPKPTLSVDAITRAAIEIADADGLGGLTMQRLAEELGVGTMTLYTYVPDKDSLLEVMLDRAYGASIGSLTPGSDWRDYLERVATSILDAYRMHPWALQVFVGGPPLGPNSVAFVESALDALAMSGLERSEWLDAVMAITAYVRGIAHLSAGIVEHRARMDLSQAEMAMEQARAYSRVLDPERFPRSYEFLVAPPEPDAGEYDYGFAFGLQRMLDGIQARVSSSR